MNQVRVGVGVLVMREDKILLLKRKNDHGRGTWSPPGGHLEYGESIEECAIRETREETGVTIRDIKFRALTNDIFEQEGRHYITIWVEGCHPSGKPSVNAPSEAEEVGWFTWQELPEPLFLPLRNLMDGRCHPLPKKIT